MPEDACQNHKIKIVALQELARDCGRKKYKGC